MKSIHTKENPCFIRLWDCGSYAAFRDLRRKESQPEADINLDIRATGDFFTEPTKYRVGVSTHHGIVIDFVTPLCVLLLAKVNRRVKKKRSNFKRVQNVPKRSSKIFKAAEQLCG